MLYEVITPPGGHLESGVPPEEGTEHPGNLPPQEDQDRQYGSEVKQQVEGQFRPPETQEVLGEDQVTGAADRQDLRNNFV